MASNVDTGWKQKMNVTCISVSDKSIAISNNICTFVLRQTAAELVWFYAVFLFLILSFIVFSYTTDHT